MHSFAESTVEEAALQWFGELGFTPKHGPHIAPGEVCLLAVWHLRYVLALSRP